jgi:alpha-ketoglutarate-dependent taurine dioxygenase
MGRDVTLEALNAGEVFPLVVRPLRSSLRLADWLREQRAYVDDLVVQFKALLFRGWDAKSADDFDSAAAATTDKPWTGTPVGMLGRREAVTKGGVFTSTSYPPHASIFPHSEQNNSAFRMWPLRIMFFCVEPPFRGGQTQIVNNARVFDRITPSIRDAFLAKGVRYKRVFYKDKWSWQSTFQTEDRSQAEARCREAGMSFEWRDGGDTLRVEWNLQACAKHPRTGELLWFNQAHGMAHSVFDPVVREIISVDREPSVDAMFGDGTPIAPAYLNHISQAYSEEAVAPRWENGDLMLLDNMAVAHGRRPYEGSRQILVAMTDPARADELDLLPAATRA